MTIVSVSTNLLSRKKSPKNNPKSISRSNKCPPCIFSRLHRKTDPNHKAAAIIRNLCMDNMVDYQIQVPSKNNKNKKYRNIQPPTVM